MQLPADLRAHIEQRIAAIKEGESGWISDDVSALMVDGGPMYCCFVSPNGQTFIEHYWVDENWSTRIDRSRRAQIETLVLGARNFPGLAELIPRRTPDAATCEACSGNGFVRRGKTEEAVYLCQPCSGLGWISADIFEEPSA